MKLTANQKKEVAKLMELLGISEDEAIQTMIDDGEIEKGGKPEWSELPEELKAGAKKARQGDRKANATKRVKKENPAKRELVQKIIAALPITNGTLNVLNPEREFEFEVDGVKYRITLACPRGKKEG